MIDKVEYFNRSPDALKVPERRMTTQVSFLPIYQQSTKAHIRTDVTWYYQRIPIPYTSGNVVRQIASIQYIEIELEILVVGHIILKKHAKCKAPVGWPSQPSYSCFEAIVNHFVCCATVDYLSRVIEVLVVIEIINLLFGLHHTKTYPAFGTFYQLGVQPVVYAHCVGFGIIGAEILQAYIVDVVGYYIPHPFEISFRSKPSGTIK